MGLRSVPMPEACKRKRADPAGTAEPNQALLDAAEGGDVEALKRALAAGADVAALDDNWFQALHLAAKEGHVQAIFALVLAGAALAGHRRQFAPLKLAAQNGHLPAVQALLAAGAELDGSALHAAAKGGHASIVGTLLAAGDEPCQDSMYYAVRSGSARCVQLLLEAGLDAEDWGSLDDAASEGSLEIVELLLKHGASPNGQCGTMPPLVAAAQDGHAAVMRVLLKAGADIEFESSNAVLSGRPLAECSTVETARVALAAGAVVQDADQRYAPLVRVAARADPEVVSLLLDAGADVDGVDKHGRTALLAAAGAGRGHAVRVLLAAGASITATDNRGRTALHLAANCAEEKDDLQAEAAAIVQTLLAAGALVSELDEQNNTPLHYAATAAVVQILLAAGAALEAKNGQGQTALCIALMRGTPQSLEALLAAGAVPLPGSLTLALRRAWLLGPWITAYLLASCSITAQELAMWVEHRAVETLIWRLSRLPVHAPLDREEVKAAKQRLVWQVWPLRGRLPSELLRRIAAMCCIASMEPYLGPVLAPAANEAAVDAGTLA